ncbi:MAG: response regulator [Bermanella sp.]
MSKILLVDDDEVFNESLREYLEYKGFTVLSAFNGKQGLDMITTDSPDLVITDIVMPEFEGIELLTAVVIDSVKAKPKIIVISGGGRIGSSNYLSVAKEMGADAVFEKPLEFKLLVEEIKRLLA